MAEIRETGITIDYDLKRVLIDTNMKGVASKLKRLGFKLIEDSKSEPYWRFEGTPRQISFRSFKKKVNKNHGQANNS